MGVHWKIQFLGGGGFTKKQYVEGNCLKKGYWTVCRFKGQGGLVKEGGVFVGGGGDWYPNAHYAPDVKRPKLIRAFTSWTPPGLLNWPIAELTTPTDPHLHFTIIFWSFVMKQNIWQLNLCSKTGISKTAWVNVSNYIITEILHKNFTHNCCQIRRNRNSFMNPEKEWLQPVTKSILEIQH